MSRHYPYLLVGGGMAADAAARGIREVDQGNQIGMLCREAHPPYNRPPLSKGLWRTGPRPMPLSRIWRNTASLGVDVLLERSAMQLDLRNQTIIDDHGETISFDRLLLATGGDPITLHPAHERILYYRTLDDYQRLRRLTETQQNFLVIGGGFIGSEIAAALAGQGKTVTMVFPEAGIGARVLPESLALHLNNVYQQRGVRVLSGEWIRSLAPDDNGVTLVTDTGSLRADVVVAGLGIRPNSALAQSAGLRTNNGIVVNPLLQTDHPAVYAAGDVVNFYNPALDQHIRVEHEENANMSGRTAGLGMAGAPEPYHLLPAFYSTIFETHFDAVGELKPDLDVWIDWQQPLQRGVIYYMRAGHVRGVLLWNHNTGIEAARQLIEGGQAFSYQDLAGRFTP